MPNRVRLVGPGAVRLSARGRIEFRNHYRVYWGWRGVEVLKADAYYKEWLALADARALVSPMNVHRRLLDALGNADAMPIDQLPALPAGEQQNADHQEREENGG
jgi:hypothetical protein